MPWSRRVLFKSLAAAAFLLAGRRSAGFTAGT